MCNKMRAWYNVRVYSSVLCIHVCGLHVTCTEPGQVHTIKLLLNDITSHHISWKYVAKMLMQAKQSSRDDFQ